MAIFPIIEAEDLVQVSDKTRIDATKSFVDAGTAIAEVKITPGKNATEVTITSGTSSDWKLDTQFDFTVDIDATNNKIDFKEGSGGELTATLSSGNYTMSALATEIKTQLDAAGALTYTVSVTDPDTAFTKFTIAAPSEISLLADTGTNKTVSAYSHIGFIEDQTGEITYTGNEVQSVEKEITLKANIGAGDTSVTKTISIISEKSDRLFSTDAMLKDHEPDILKWVPQGRSSFKNVHRLAQTQIFGWMDKEGFVDILDNKFDKTRAVDLEEFEQWSKFLTLRLIMDGISNKVDDIFFKKARQYEALEKHFRERAVLRIDVDADGDIDQAEQIDIGHGTILRT